MTVADLARRLRGALERVATSVWVEGEASSIKTAPSGHVYFTLKDEREDAAVDCVMYRMDVMRAGRALREGARVLVRGKATLWAPRGKLQFIVDAARLAGRGALLEALEELRKKLADEGLFAQERKRKLPAEPRIVGVVTSRGGAAIHDIARVAFRRGGARLLLASASVQGATAPAEIISALDRLERVAGLSVIIVGRGGGAAEDLAAFQDERVVRRVAACRVPVVSAVGHEVDVTLTDLVADVRAATPSQAAELVVPERSGQAARLRDVSGRLVRAMRARLAEDRVHHERLARRLGDPRALLDEPRQQVDELTARLEAAMRTHLAGSRAASLRLSARLAARHPRAVLAERRSELAPLTARLEAAAARRIEVSRGRVGRIAARLSALSPLAVLGRGYAIALGPSGRAILRSSDVQEGDTLRIRLHEGSISARVVCEEDEES